VFRSPEDCEHPLGRTMARREATKVTGGGEAGVEKVRERAKARSGTLGGTRFKGNAEAKGTGTVAERRTRSVTHQSAEGWESVVH